MIAYTMEDMKTKGMRKAEKVYDLQKLSIIPINQRSNPNEEVLLVSATGGKRVVSREEVSKLGYTYTDGSEIKLSRLSSKYSIYVVRPIRENVNVVYVPKGRYVEHRGKKITNKYIIVNDKGKVSTCSKKIFHKLFRFLPDIRIDNIIDTIVRRNRKASNKIFSIEAKVIEDGKLKGYVVENMLTGRTESYTIKECVNIVKNKQMYGDVRIVVTNGGQQILGGSDVDKLGNINS